MNNFNIWPKTCFCAGNHDLRSMLEPMNDEEKMRIHHFN